MDEDLGYIAFEAQRPRFLDTPELTSGGCRVAESTQARIDAAIRAIVMGVFERAYGILEANRAVLERCAQELLARETLDEDDIRRLTQGLRHETADTALPPAVVAPSPNDAPSTP
jgi:cell division protease FtsH